VFKVVAYDFGVKRNILRMLTSRGCQVTVVPAQTPGADVLAMKPHGIFLSNGPGDPEPCDYAIRAIQEILAARIPTYGICLGHQLLGLASGARTIKMKFGHHGGNHPVQDLDSKRVMITSQNHGFAVDGATLPANLRATHVSLFDGSLQGIARTDVPAFSFQGHPEASPGPHDVAYLFDRFIAMMRDHQANKHDKKKRDAQAYRPQIHPDHRRRPHRHRPGLRVRLFRRPGLQGAQGRGVPGHPGELQPGHHHDRSGDGGRHLHRAHQLANGGTHPGKERPDAILPTMGGQTALNCALDLAKHGVLEKYGVILIGASKDAIDKAEDREKFKQAMARIGLANPRSALAHSMEEALQIQAGIGFPTIIRPSFTMGGSGGGIAYNMEEFVTICERGLEASPTKELLIEESLIGWKEFEMEVTP
jgi:anthranilate/para-aminobenzoate synthase component II